MDSLVLNKISGRKIILGILIIGLIFLVSFTNIQSPPLIFLGLIVFLIVTILIFKNPVLGLVLVVFFLPFERIGAYELNNLTIRVSQILTIVTLIAWITNGILKKKIELAKNPTVLPLALFVIINLFSLVNTLNIERSSAVLLFTLFTIIFSLLIPNLIRNKEGLNKVVITLLFSAFLVSIFGIYQFIGDSLGLSPEITGLREQYTKTVLGFPRAQGTAFEPLYFANYLLIPLGIVFSLFLSHTSKIKSHWLVGCLIILGLALVLTISRGGYLGLAALFLTISLYYLKNIFTPKRILLLALVLIVVWFSFTRFLGLSDALNLESFRLHTLNVFYGGSFVERVETLESALSAFRDHPFLGVGVGGFGPYVSIQPYFFPIDGWKIVNNEFVEILAETGILGLITFLVFLLFLVIRSFKAIKSDEDPYLKALAIGTLGGFLGILVQYQTFSTLYIMHVWFLFGLMVAVQNLILIKNTGDEE